MGSWREWIYLVNGMVINSVLDWYCLDVDNHISITLDKPIKDNKYESFDKMIKEAIKGVLL